MAETSSDMPGDRDSADRGKVIKSTVLFIIIVIL
jgi:hypothetical protein